MVSTRQEKRRMARVREEATVATSTAQDVFMVLSWAKPIRSDL